MDLTKKVCVACEGGVKPMGPAEEKEYLGELGHGWSLGKRRILKEYKFKDFNGAIRFINDVARIAEAEGHHPDIHLERWNHVRIELYTHAIGGLHENDFIVAAKIEALKKDY